MNQTLLQQIDTMRKEMVAMVEEQGMSIQDALVIEKSQSLVLLLPSMYSKAVIQQSDKDNEWIVKARQEMLK